MPYRDLINKFQAEEANKVYSFTPPSINQSGFGGLVVRDGNVCGTIEEIHTSHNIGMIEATVNLDPDLNKVHIDYRPAIDKVVYHGPATIVFWTDGTKTVVKCGKKDIFDPEKGLAMAIAKKAFGNCGNYYDIFKKHLPKRE